ncbi:MAG: bifunctional diaminohydroxyphosphoribosylaminopyrimidine deaminase/5-amino-6-(5-phosphoribosylamino)uracil reductase RibD [Candidatus Nanopelagicales bacterium]
MSDPWVDEMRQAIELAYLGPRSENPRVGCVIVDSSGAVVGQGSHQGAGTAHAEVVALDQAGDRAKGATAVVTLEPCRHTGRTGPCTEALLAAGIARVVYAQGDPTKTASGGATVLREAGIEVIAGVGADQALPINTAWTHVQVTGRPYVVLKLAQTLDGRVADSGGGPTAITGPAARRLTHALRAESDAVLVGTSTALVDDPALTVREIGVERQPLRVVMGERDLPTGLRVFDDAAQTLVIRDRRPLTALGLLSDAGVQQVLIEGGPRLAAAFLEAALVDEVVWFLAPTLLGGGPVSIPELGVPIAVDVTAVTRIGNDVMVRGRVAFAS